MVARADTLVGTLTISEEHAEFVSGDVPGRAPWTGAGGREERGLRFQPVLDVLVGRRGTDYLNGWIELRFGDSANPSTVWRLAWMAAHPHEVQSQDRSRTQGTDHHTITGTTRHPPGRWGSSVLLECGISADPTMQHLVPA
jgi:hypothetical protein